MLTRRQKAGLEPLIKTKKKYRKKTKKIHESWLVMILLLPLYGLMILRKEIAKDSANSTPQNSPQLSSQVSPDIMLNLESSSDDEIIVRKLQEPIESEDENKGENETSEAPKCGPKLNFKRFVLKNQFNLIEKFNKSNYFIIIKIT